MATHVVQYCEAAQSAGPYVCTRYIRVWLCQRAGLRLTRASKASNSVPSIPSTRWLDGFSLNTCYRAGGACCTVVVQACCCAVDGGGGRAHGRGRSRGGGGVSWSGRRRHCTKTTYSKEQQQRLRHDLVLRRCTHLEVKGAVPFCAGRMGGGAGWVCR